MTSAVDGEQRDASDGTRIFAGPRWDPFILDAPAMLKTIATRELAFTDPGAIYLDGKNVLGIVVEIDRSAVLGDMAFVGVAAETLTRGKLNVRLESAGRPEVPNMMLGPMQFDRVNRDLEIRDLYNMDDVVSPGARLRGCVPRAAEREPGLLGRARRQGRLAAGRAGRTPADRTGPGGLTWCSTPASRTSSRVRSSRSNSPPREGEAHRPAAAGRSTTTSWTGSSRS